MIVQRAARRPRGAEQLQTAGLPSKKSAALTTSQICAHGKLSSATDAYLALGYSNSVVTVARFTQSGHLSMCSCLLPDNSPV